MGDIKLFQTGGDGVVEIEGRSMAVEKSLQGLIERSLDAFLGVTFLVSEYSTGKTHGGRIDTLGIDENRCPVIIEYKRGSNQNVINQGLFYLNWLLDHKAEFELLVLRQLGEQVANGITWSGARVVCVAGDYAKYDLQAAQQINSNLDLIRYRQFGQELFMLEWVISVTAMGNGVAAPTIRTARWAPEPAPASRPEQPESTDNIAPALCVDVAVADLFEALRSYLMGLGSDVEMRTAKSYIAFRRRQHFASVEIVVRRKLLRVFVKVDPDSVTLEVGFTRDVRRGVLPLEITLLTVNDLEKAKPLLKMSYEAS